MITEQAKAIAAFQQGIAEQTLQKLMRHRSCITTLGYINLASQLDDAITSRPVPKVLQKDEGKQDENEAKQPKKKPDDEGSSG